MRNVDVRERGRLLHERGSAAFSIVSTGARARGERCGKLAGRTARGLAAELAAAVRPVGVRGKVYRGVSARRGL